MLESGHIVTINILVSATGVETYVLLWKRFFLELGKVTHMPFMAVNNLTLTEADVAVCSVAACLV